MEWLNLHVSILDSDEVLNATPGDRSTWLLLLRYCIGQENSGILRDVKVWNDRTWLRNAAISLKEVSRACKLWKWEGDDLVVTFYPIDSEHNVHRLRGQAARAGHASWHKRRIKTVEPLGKPDGSPLGLPPGDPTGEPYGNAKRKGKKGKGKEGNITPPNPQPGGREKVDEPPSRNRSVHPSAIIPAEQPDPLRERLLAVGQLKGRTETSPWSADDMAAFRAARLDDCAGEIFAHQLDQLRTYYSASIPREMDRRRHDLKALLANWSGELDRARAWVRDHNDGITKL